MHTEPITPTEGKSLIRGLPTPPEGSGMLCCLDCTGHTETMWDRRNKVEIKAARASFKILTKKGYLAFNMNKDGTKGELIHEFDPDAERIILSPPLVGG